MDKEAKRIDYNFFHWGPFLYRTTLLKEEIDAIKNLCSKKNKDYRENLAGIIKHEHEIDRKKMFPIIAPYLQSYLQAFAEYNPKRLGNKLELVTAWVNYMTKFETNPLHTHDDDLSFVLFTQVPKELKEEYNKNVGNTKPGAINFIYSLEQRKELMNQHSFFPLVGELFIFPACLNHYVNGFQCEGERISISGNVRITNG
tara:strand:+ start:944 stop:1543 length:600 start_codon:yes stop_codon:yes gene_type:complete